MDKSIIRKKVTGNPAQNIAGLQDDWWTEISPDLWNSHGAFLRDINGDEYLDCCGFFSTAPIRYDHPSFREKSFLELIAKVALYRPSLGDFWTVEFADFIDTFRKHATPSYMHHFFFIDGGSLAVENTLKAAFDWKVRINMQKGLIKNDPVEEPQPLGTKVICFENAFHGRSGYTLSLTHTNDPRKYKYFPKFDWFRVRPPFYVFTNQGEIQNQDTIDQQIKESVHSVRLILEEHGDDVAAILIEPIQCEGGDRHIPFSFFKELRKLADAFEVLLIYDEVQTGFGTTGKMWNHEYFGENAKPDMISFSKKSQVGGVLADGNKLSQVEGNVFSNSEQGRSRLNSTWGGNPVDMVRAGQYLKVIHEENLLSNGREMGSYFLKGIQDLCQQFADLIGNPRGKGLLLGFDALTTQYDKGSIWSAFKNEKLLSLVCGERTVRFRPQLDINKTIIDDALSRMKKALTKLG